MNSIVRKAAHLAVVTGAVATVSMAGATAATAEPVQHGCAYPYVCFYASRAAVDAGPPGRQVPGRHQRFPGPDRTGRIHRPQHP